MAGVVVRLTYGWWCTRVDEHGDWEDMGPLDLDVPHSLHLALAEDSPVLPRT